MPTHIPDVYTKQPLAPIRVLRLKKYPIWDIFIGNGWKNWSRVLKDKFGKYHVLSGNELNQKTITQIMGPKVS